MVSAMNPGVQSQLAEGMRDEGLIRYVSFGGGGRGMGEGGMYGGDDGDGEFRTEGALGLGLLGEGNAGGAEVASGCNGFVILRVRARGISQIIIGFSHDN